MKVVSVDCETTGLDFRMHEAWEIAVVPYDGPPLCFHFPVTKLNMASPDALVIGGFYDRYEPPSDVHHACDIMQGGAEVPALDALTQIAKATNGATLLGASVHFDAEHIRTQFHSYGMSPSWHHRHLDLGSLCMGAWGGTEPWGTAKISKRIPNPNVHDALADAEWNLEVYRTIVGSQVS